MFAGGGCNDHLTRAAVIDATWILELIILDTKHNHQMEEELHVLVATIRNFTSA